MAEKLEDLFVDNVNDDAAATSDDGVQEPDVDGEGADGVDPADTSADTGVDDGTTQDDDGADTGDSTEEDTSLEYLQRRVEELEREKRLLQSKKDREIWEMQQRLKQLEEMVLSEGKEPEDQKPQLDPEEIKEMLFENPVEAIRKVIETMTPEMIEQVFPKITQKQMAKKQEEVVEKWKRDAEILGKLPDYADIINDEEHPLTQAIREFVIKNHSAYLMAGKETLIVDALKYAKDKVKVKRDTKPDKKKTSIVGKKSSPHPPSQPSSKGTIDELFDE